MSDDEHGWNHAQCYTCWFAVWGISRTPARLKQPHEENCCYCGRPTMSGIYVREKPGSFKIPFCRDMFGTSSPFLPDRRGT